ncbi:uncharacterized protein HMPREF1541_08384 [Cyphellophora europaea CBS 101466]|uniref:AB hydrolase-1 domain-containing protein n=1 Tax=Cyphellophora europaea (strain CBS 101466) TaxID=1220924 RepID=W2RNZ4_CYPE1|nr:uncharacterized protein HMPREF1541_08384 [Cyphellophora europaea CBS 101466]ETN37393.1 hypothetical protein HMPREF1541_08384 [Cyphellophora europaea CBS 101466]
MSSSPPKPAIVLVPGGGHLARSFAPLTTYLTSHSYTATPVDLPSNLITIDPSTSAAFPTTYEADVAAVASAITTHADAGKDVVVLFHSYGGVPGNTACKDLLKASRQAQGKPGGVVHQIYFSSMALPLGMSPRKLAGGELPHILELSDDGKTVFAPGGRELFAHDISDPKEADLLVEALVPMSIQAFDGEVGYEAWREGNSTYVLTLDDRSLPVEMQKGIVEGVRKTCAEDGKGRLMETVEVAGGHDAWFGNPEGVGDVIRGIVEKAS